MTFQFIDEDENEQHKQVFAYFGNVVFFSQCLEASLINLLLFDAKIKNKKMSPELYDGLFEKHKQKTLHALINELKQVYSLSDVEVTQLKEISIKRNYIVHNYFKDKIQMFCSKNGRELMIDEFQEFRNNLQSLDEKLREKQLLFMDKIGYTEKDVETELDDLKREYCTIIYS